MANAAIQELFTRFLSDLRELLEPEIHEKASAELIASLKSQAGAGAAPKAKGKPGPKPRKGAKREPGDIDALTEQLFAAMKKAPNSRIEELSKELGVSTKELALPVKRLLESKRARKSGQRRATRYFVK